MQENIQIQFYSEPNFTNNFKNPFSKILIPFYSFFIFLVEYFRCKYFVYQFRKKYGYSSLKLVHSNLKSIVLNLKKRSKSNDWIINKRISLYSDLSKFLDTKKKQESEFFTGLMQSFTEVNEKTNHKSISEMTKSLENYLKMIKDWYSTKTKPMQYEFETIINLIVYLAERVPNISKSKLLKLMQFVDNRAFENSGVYVTWKNESELKEYIQTAENRNYIGTKKHQNETIVFPKRTTNLNYFSENELISINSIIQNYKEFKKLDYRSNKDILNVEIRNLFHSAAIESRHF